MGGPYKIPRNVKGEGRILYIFSTKGLIFTAVGGFLGVLIYMFLKPIGLTKIGWGAIILFGLIGFAIGSMKVPNTNAFEITRKTSGENIDEVLLRWIKFKTNKNKYYSILKEEETKDAK